MKDFFGEELNVGDIVAYSGTGDTTDLRKGTVVKLCAKTVKIEGKGGTWACYRPPQYCVKNLSNSAYDEE